MLQNGAQYVKKIKGVFVFKVNNGPGGKQGIWVVDVKNGNGSVKHGADGKYTQRICKINKIRPCP